MGHARVLHHRSHIGKVQVDESGILDEVGNGLYRLAQHIIGDLKGVLEGDFLVGGKFEPFIGDDDQGIHLAPQLLDAGLGLLASDDGLQRKGLGHHTHGKEPCLLRDISHDGGRARAGATAHAGGDEHHIRILQSLGDLPPALLRGFASHIRIGAGALTARQLLPIWIL